MRHALGVGVAVVDDERELAPALPHPLEIGTEGGFEGIELVGGTPEQFGALIRAEQEKWAPIIRSANIKID